MASRLVQGYSPAGFGPGVEVTYWNGIPIARAVDAGSASVTVTGVAGPTSVKAKGFAGGELVAARRVDIG